MDSTNKKIIIYDFCGTLTTIQTADRFVLFAMKKNLINYIKFAFIYIFHIIEIILSKLHIKRKFNTSKESYLKLIKGYSQEYLESKANKYAQYLFQKKSRKDISNSLLQSKNSDTRYIIASAGYQIYIKYYAEYLGISEVLASKFVYKDNIFSGQIDRPVFGKDKSNYINEYLELSKNKYHITLYSDSIADLESFIISDTKIAVYPTRRLRKYAKQNQWQIIG